MADPKDMETRLAALEGEGKKKGGGITVGKVALLIAGSIALVAFMVAVNAQKEVKTPLDTSEVTDFQRDGASGGRLQFDDPAPQQAVEEAIIRIDEVLAPEPAPQQVVVTENPALAEELAAMRQQLADSNAARDQAISNAVTGLKTAFEERSRELQQAAEEAKADLQALETTSAARQQSLQTLLDAETARREALELEMQKAELNSAEAARAEQAARDAAELEKAQITSPALVFASGQSASASSSSSPSGGGYNASENEEFLRNAPALTVSTAEQMPYPEQTLAQGSVIQAVLQTAINSDLPGNAVAVISEPVPSFAGDKILVPRGSRLFGSYRSGIETNQKRILIVWSRILTPEGKSMEISSVGGDALGRSGLTGFVDTKFGERFGGAALISLIGAAPSIAAQQANDEIASDTLESVGEDLEDATGTVIADQLSISPTIYIDQGASVTVLVDRDVEIF
ncbi:MAG: TrbI/VirB10 family protein [Thalassovita sp.]